MPAMSVTIASDVYIGLEKAIKKSGFTRSKITNMALENYLSEMKDIYEAEEIASKIDRGEMQTFTLAEAKKELGI